MPKDDVALRNPRGDLVYIPASDATEALKQGYKALDAPDIREVRQREQYGQGIGTELRAAAEGAARGVTFGGSDLALQALGADKEGLAERKTRNPIAEGIGEAAGIGLGIAGTGGIGAGVRGVASAARGAESVAARALAELGADGVGAKLATKAVAGAVEGGAYGAGQGVSEASLGEPSDVANTLLAHATMGALFGGGVGAGIGALGSVAKALGGAGRRVAEKMATRGALVADDGAAIGNLASRAKVALEDLQGEQALDAAGLMKRDYKALQRSAKTLEGEEGVAAAEDLTLHDEAKRILREQKLVRAGDTMADVGERVQGAIVDASKRAKDLISKLDTSQKPAFNLRQYADDLEKYAGKFADSPEQASEYKGIMDRVSSYRELADKKGDITLGEAERIKRTFDKAFAGTNAAKQIARESRGIFNGQIEATVKEAATPEEFAAWRQDKRTMEALIPVRKANTDRQAAMQSNRKISLTDYLNGGGLGLGAAHFVGGPAAAATALAGSLVHKVIRERGNAVVSDVAGRMAASLGSQEARAAQLLAIAEATGKVNKSITKSVTGFMDTLDKAPRLVAPAVVKASHEIAFGPSEKYIENEENQGKKHLDQLTRLMNDPETMRTRLAESLGDLQTAAPRVSAEMHLQAVQGMNYLWSKAPKNDQVAMNLHLMDEWEPSPSEARSFERTLRAVHDPVGTIHDMQNGHITREGIDALANVYPALHQRLVSELLPQLAQAKNIPVQKQLELADILGVSISPLTSPQLGAAIQAAYNTQAKQAAAPPRPLVSKNYRAQQSSTPLQRALENIG